MITSAVRSCAAEEKLQPLVAELVADYGTERFKSARDEVPDTGRSRRAIRHKIAKLAPAQVAKLWKQAARTLTISQHRIPRVPIQQPPVAFLPHRPAKSVSLRVNQVHGNPGP